MLEYARMTAREVPVVVLEPVDPPRTGLDLVNQSPVISREFARFRPSGRYSADKKSPDQCRRRH
jgi:hypothetical protein